MIKNNIITICIGAINLVAAILLTIFCVPSQIPLIVNFSEEIVFLGTKWILLLNAIIPMAIAITLCFTKKYKTAQKIALAISLYENLLIFSYFCMQSSFEIGTKSMIPLSASIFIPLSLCMLIYASKIKFAPFKSISGIINKYSIQTEFIWSQTQLFAKDAFLLSGLILLLVSIVFVFVRFGYICFAVFAIGILIPYLITLKQSKNMYKKYIYMKNKKDKMNEEKK